MTTKDGTILCDHCKHYGKNGCPAFPEPEWIGASVPVNFLVFFGHFEKIHGQQGDYTFSPIEGAKINPRDYKKPPEKYWEDEEFYFKYII